MLSKLAAFAAALAVAVLFSHTAAAVTVVGVPIKSLTDGTHVGTGNVAADGTIGFYIPLTIPETFGTTGSGLTGGLTSDTCMIIGGCPGNTLTMFLEYTPVSMGTNLVTLDFNDLDLGPQGGGANDPVGFFEAIKFYDSFGGILADVDDVSDPEVFFFDQVDQVLKILVTGVTDPFRAKLALRSYGNIPKYARNTKEYMLTTIEPIPVPAALPLLGSALLWLGLVGRRRRRAVA